MNKPYWLRMSFPDAVTSIVRSSLKAGLWRGTAAERLVVLKGLNERLSTFYGVPACFVTVRQTLVGPHYVPGDGRIVLDKVSIVSYLHELGHHLLHCRSKPQQETFPRAFSLSLFFRSAPRSFEAARASGRLLFTERGTPNA